MYTNKCIKYFIHIAIATFYKINKPLDAVYYNDFTTVNGVKSQ